MLMYDIGSGPSGASSISLGNPRLTASSFLYFQAKDSRIIIMTRPVHTSTSEHRATSVQMYDFPEGIIGHFV